MVMLSLDSEPIIQVCYNNIKHLMKFMFNDYNIYIFTGFWLFHCHFLFHITIGMNLILQVGTHADLPPVPPNFPTCGDHLPPIMP